MATPSSRTEFKDYCLRSLGFPVIDINVDEDQVEDRVDEALQTYAEFHYDATHADYLAIKVDAAQLANSANASNANTFGWLPLPENVIGVSRMFPITGDTVRGGGSSANFNIFDLNYQLRLNELYEFTSSSYQYYWIARTHIRMLELILIGQPPIRYSKHMGRVYIDMAWNAKITPDTYLLLECTTLLSPDTYTRVWNDKWLKEYGTTLIKRQWGENMKKYGNYTLPGGMIINGQGIYEEAINEQRRLEQVLRDTWEEPPQFLIG
jgi:hypothetical protein